MLLPIDLTSLDVCDLRELKEQVDNALYNAEHGKDGLKYGLKFLSVQEVDEWMCYEEGVAKQFIWMHGDEKWEVLFVQHSSKNTYTMYMSVTINGKVWEFEYGDYGNSHTVYDSEHLSLDTIFEKCNVNTDNIEEMIRLLGVLVCEFHDDIVDCEELEDELREYYEM